MSDVKALLLAMLCAVSVSAARADPSSVVQAAYDAAKARYATNGGDDETAWRFACACFDEADATATSSRRAALANEGIEACRKLLRKSPKLAAAHYYLAMDLGELAQTKTLGALPIVKEMATEWETARVLDEHFDFAGPDRNLGLLYRDTPGFPISIGSDSKAEQHIKRAVELAPDYPENRLNLIETRLKQKLWDQAEAEDATLRALLPAARKTLSGPQWQDSWADWDKRQREVLEKLRPHVAARAGQTPPP